MRERERLWDQLLVQEMGSVKGAKTSDKKGATRLWRPDWKRLIGKNVGNEAMVGVMEAAAGLEQ